jgi:Holliday junction resolvase
VEKKVQTRLIKYLRSKGCYVIKLSAVPGVPTGCPDVLALYEGWWGAFECKASAKAPFQPLQEYTIQKFEKWSTAYVVHPDNIDEVISQLEKML